MNLQCKRLIDSTVLEKVFDEHISDRIEDKPNISCIGCTGKVHKHLLEQSRRLNFGVLWCIFGVLWYIFGVF